MALRARGVPRLFFGGAAACAILDLVLTLSRGGWLAAAVSTSLFLCLLITTIEGLAFLKRNNRLILTICFFGLVSVTALSGTIMGKLFESANTNISSRMELNEMASDMIKDHPLTGVGLNNSVVASDNYNLRDQFMVFSGLPPVIHNIYLLIGAEVGVHGILALVTFILYLLIRGLAMARKHMGEGDIAFFLTALAVGGFAYLAADMFGPGLRKLEISYLFWGHLGMITLLTNTIGILPQPNH
jgi:O-antigen ligase